MNGIESLRCEIDKIDKEMAMLFEKRMEIAIKIGEYKKKNKLEVLNTNREKQVIKNNIKYIKNKKLCKPVEEFFVCMMKISKELQK